MREPYVFTVIATPRFSHENKGMMYAISVAVAPIFVTVVTPRFYLFWNALIIAPSLLAWRNALNLPILIPILKRRNKRVVCDHVEH